MYFQQHKDLENVLIFMIKSSLYITDKCSCPLCAPITVFSGVKLYRMNKEIIWIYISNHASILALLDYRDTTWKASNMFP